MDDKSKPRVIKADALGIEVAKALGIDIDYGRINRIIIDISTGSVVSVYVELVGTDRLLTLDWGQLAHGEIQWSDSDAP